MVIIDENNSRVHIDEDLKEIGIIKYKGKEIKLERPDYCSQCGQKIDKGEQGHSCPECGENFYVHKQTSANYCIRCGKELL